MINLIVVLFIVGTVTSYLYGTDQAIIAGQNVLEWWILAGLAVTFLTPIFRILGIGVLLITIFTRFIRWIARKCKGFTKAHSKEKA